MEFKHFSSINELLKISAMTSQITIDEATKVISKIKEGLESNTDIDIQSILNESLNVVAQNSLLDALASNQFENPDVALNTIKSTFPDAFIFDLVSNATRNNLPPEIIDQLKVSVDQATWSNILNIASDQLNFLQMTPLDAQWEMKQRRSAS